MAFNLPPLPFPREPGTNNPYIATPDEAGGYVVPHGNYFKKKVGDINLWIPVSAEDPLPTENANIDVTLSALRNALLGTGNKTLTDLATALAPLATTEKQEELVSALGEILVQLQAGSPVSVTESVLPEGASTAEKQEALTALIGALDTAAVSDPAASGTVISLLKGLLSQLQAGSPVSVTESSLPAGAATDAEIQTLQEKVDALNTKIDGITDGTAPAKTELTGSIATTISSPETGIKTVTATAAEVFAGATRKANRRKLSIRNESTALRFRVGKSDVTQQNGFPVEPGATIIFEFDPKTAVPIYAISEGAALKVGVCEE